jgi:ribonuclease III
VIPLRKADTLSVWVERSFGHVFQDAILCMTAITHRSAGGQHNERLEFLGDSVLNCCVAKILFDARPDADEGALSRWRASLVSEASLASIASELGVGEHLRLGSGELKSGGFRRASILADALEAMIGAIFLDAGFGAANAAILRLLEARIASLPEAEVLKDPKTRLQEALQARGISLPLYTLTSASGEAHAQTFIVGCEVSVFGFHTAGEGNSRRGAEQAAAEKMLQLLPQNLRVPS